MDSAAAESSYDLQQLEVSTQHFPSRWSDGDRRKIQHNSSSVHARRQPSLHVLRLEEFLPTISYDTLRNNPRVHLRTFDDLQLLRRIYWIQNLLHHLNDTVALPPAAD